MDTVLADVAARTTPIVINNHPVLCIYYTAWLNSAALCVQIPVQVPVDICGNAVGPLGFANASCQGGAAAFLDSFNS
jgi:hypothetical protein